MDAKVTQGLSGGKPYQVFDLGSVELADGKPIQVNLGNDKICIIVPTMIQVMTSNMTSNMEFPIKDKLGCKIYYSITYLDMPTNSILPANYLDGTTNYVYMRAGPQFELKFTFERTDSLGSLQDVLHPATNAILGKVSIVTFSGNGAEVVFEDVGIRMTPIFAMPRPELKHL